MFAVRFFVDRRVAAKTKIGMSRVAARPAAGPWSECEDFFGESRGRIGAGRRRISRRLTAVGRSGEGDLFDLGDRDRSRGQETKHDVNAARNAAIAVLPPSDAPRADAEQLGDSMLCEAERVKLSYFGGLHRGHPISESNGRMRVSPQIEWPSKSNASFGESPRMFNHKHTLNRLPDRRINPRD